MQRARRLATSAAPRSTPANSGAKTRKRSRSSSSEEDDDSSPESKKPGNASNKKAKTRTGKGNTGSPKRPVKTLKPNSESLQNAIVVAPFSALKLTFQNKLINLYSVEKTKQIDLKTRVAKKRNMSFEYDVLEYKPSGSDLKKDKKSKKKQSQKQGSSRYCQCDRTWTRSMQNETKSRSQRHSKQRGISHIQKMEILSEDQPSFAYPSSPSRDSDAGSAFFREETMKGSLAISATSFESYLQKFDEGSSKESKPKNRKTPERKMGLSPGNAGCSRNMIGPAENKNSDGQIVDFADREPQTQLISEASNQHLRPLQRQSRSLVKKPENESASGYHLRSTSKEMFGTVNQNFIPHCKPEVQKIETGTQVDHGSSDDEQNPEESPTATTEEQLDTNPGSAESPEIQSPPEVVTSPEKGISLDFMDVDTRETNPSLTPQDQESGFIFGQRSTSARLGESCEFPFGLK